MAYKVFKKVFFLCLIHNLKTNILLLHSSLSTERAQTEKAIRTNLKTIMMAVDLEEVTSKFVSK